MFWLVFAWLVSSVVCQAPPPSPTLAPPSTFPSTSGSTITSPSTTTSTSNTTQTTSASTTTTTQFPDLGGVSSCVANCLNVAVSRVNCSSVIQVDCFCADSHFPAELSACIMADCSSEIKTAEGLAQQFCNLTSGKPSSLSFPAIPATQTPTTTTSSPTTTSPPPTTTTTTTTGGAGGSVRPRLAEACVLYAGTVLGLSVASLALGSAALLV